MSEPRPQDLPLDQHAEEAVLANLLINPETFADVADVIDPADFGAPANAAIYRAIVACDAAGNPFDLITVTDELRRSGDLDRVGGRARLEELLSQQTEPANITAHCEIIASKATLRRLLGASTKIYRNARSDEADAKEQLQRAEEEIFAIGRKRSSSNAIEMPQAVAETMAELAAMRNSQMVGHSTGFKSLDDMTGGLQGGQLLIVAARPSMGKSAWSISLARHIAATSGDSVAFLSYEMSRMELTTRMLSSQLGANLLQIRQGNLPPGMDKDLSRVSQKLSELPMVMYENPPQTIGAVRSEMRRLARRAPLAAVFVDYLQLMSGSGRSQENRTVEVSEISRGLKLLARELDTVVVALSQLSRQPELRNDKRPMLSDLRASGCLVPETTLRLADGSLTTIGQLADRWQTDQTPVAVVSFDETTGRLVGSKITNVFSSGIKTTFRLTTRGGRTVQASGNHPFWVQHDGWVRTDELVAGQKLAAATHRGTVEFDALADVEQVGRREVFDATVADTHSFVADGLVAHNSIEQDADMVAFLFRPTVYDKSANPTDAELILAKQRNGPIGTIHMDFIGETATFKEAPNQNKGVAPNAGPADPSPPNFRGKKRGNDPF